MQRRFRIGSTSYVYPDEILPNVRRLAKLVDDIELVLFEVDEYGSNLPAPNDVAELNALAAANDMTFTVHLPLDLHFGDEVSFDKARRAIEATCTLGPFAWIVHLDGRELRGTPSADRIRRWRENATRAILQIVEWTGEASRVCIENLEGWDPEIFSEVVAAAGVSRCIDIGHLWLQGADPVTHLNAHLPRTRVIHLHGVGRRDHLSLADMPRDELQRVLEVLLQAEYAGVLTLEVFGEEDFVSSCAVLSDILRRAGVEWTSAN